MERCFFNSCILNDNDYLTQYKRCFTDPEGLFISVSRDDNLINSLNIISNLNKYVFCSEHYNKLQDLLKIKEAIISKPENIPKDILIILNKILKNDIDIKKLLYRLSFQRNTNIIRILAKNLYTTNDKDNKLYLLLNLNHLLKEHLTNKADKNISEDFEDKDEKHLDNEIFVILCKEIKDLKIVIYDLIQNNVKLPLNDENFFRDVILYNLLLSNIECLFYKWNNTKEILDIKKTDELIENTLDILSQVVIGYGSISKETKRNTSNEILNELFYHIIGFINIYLSSNVKNFELVLKLIKKIIEINENIYAYLISYKDEDYFKSSTKNYITTLNTLLENMLGVSLDEMDKNNLNTFLKNSEAFNRDKKHELLYYKNNEMIQELKEKIKIYNLNKNNNKLNIDEE